MPEIKNDDSKGSLTRLLNQAVTSGSAGDLEIMEYLNTNFGTIESLENVDGVIGELNSQITEIDDQLKEVIRDQAYAAETARMQLDTINDRSSHLIDRIANVKETAASSESLVKTGCTEIRKLDTAKKNLTFSITALKRLIMLRKSPAHFFRNFNCCCLLFSSRGYRAILLRLHGKAIQRGCSPDRRHGRAS